MDIKLLFIGKEDQLVRGPITGIQPNTMISSGCVHVSPRRFTGGTGGSSAPVDPHLFSAAETWRDVCGGSIEAPLTKVTLKRTQRNTFLRE